MPSFEEDREKALRGLTSALVDYHMANNERIKQSGSREAAISQINRIEEAYEESLVQETSIELTSPEQKIWDNRARLQTAYEAVCAAMEQHVTGNEFRNAVNQITMEAEKAAAREVEIRLAAENGTPIAKLWSEQYQIRDGSQGRGTKGSRGEGHRRH